jgi:hypothetical protein
MENRNVHKSATQGEGEGKGEGEGERVKGKTLDEALCRACDSGDVASAELLLEKGASVNARVPPYVIDRAECSD